MDVKPREEKAKVRHGDGTLTITVRYTPRTGRPVRLYRLTMSVDEADGCSPNVFVYQRATCGAPMEDGSPRDEFVCVSDELSEDEIPVGEPDLERNVPYYRVRDLELLFRDYRTMREAAKSILASLAC